MIVSSSKMRVGGHLICALFFLALNTLTVCSWHDIKRVLKGNEIEKGHENHNRTTDL